MDTTQTATMKSGTAAINGITMYYEIHGCGNPLVLIHGGGSTINTNYSRMIPLFAKTHQVIAVEMQAHGRTSDRAVPETFAQDADDIAALLKYLNISKADVLGFSNGGQTCFELGMRHPDVIRKLVIASAFYKRDGAFPGFWDGFEKANISMLPPVYKDAFLKVNNNPEALQAMFDRDVQRMSTFKDWTDDNLRSIKVPVLIVSGDRDVALPEHTVAISRLIPNSRLAILPGNHGSYMGEAMTPGNGSKIPELFATMVDEFLAEQ